VKVKELIELLGTFDPELPVAVDGYEWGMARILPSAIKRVTVIHESHPVVRDENDPVFDVLYISRHEIYEEDRQSYGGALEIND